MTDASRSYDAIVIGSGVGGLTAALYLARSGHRVAVLEAAQQFGGFLNPFARKRFHFDTGVHYVGDAHPGALLPRTYRQLGLPIDFVELDPEGFDWYLFPGYDVKLCRGAERFMQRLIDDFPAERKGLHRFFVLLEELQRSLRMLSKIRGPLSALQSAPKLPTILRWRKATLKAILDEHFTDPLLKCALAGPCGDLGLPPGRVSGIYHLSLLTHYLAGGYYPRGGSGAMRDAYVEGLKQAGATLRRNIRVERILHRHGVAAGVITEGGEVLSARAVISNAEAPATFFMAGLDRCRKLRKKISGLEPSLGSFMVFLGVEGDLEGCTVGDNNVWHYGSTDIDGAYERVNAGGLPDGESFFLTIPTLKDPRSQKAPEGHHVVELVTLMTSAPFERWFRKPSMKRGEDYQALKERIAQPLIAAAERYVPNLRQRIVIKETSTPVTNAHYVNNDTGAIYGPAHTPDQVLLDRFATKTPIEGLFLAGASVIGCGISPCTRSGWVAGKLTQQYLREKKKSWATGALRWARGLGG